MYIYATYIYTTNHTWNHRYTLIHCMFYVYALHYAYYAYIILIHDICMSYLSWLWFQIRWASGYWKSALDPWQGDDFAGENPIKNMAKWGMLRSHWGEIPRGCLRKPFHFHVHVCQDLSRWNLVSLFKPLRISSRWLITCLTFSGWWYTYPSEKYAKVSWDDDYSQYMEKIKCRFQTTKQSFNHNANQDGDAPNLKMLWIHQWPETLPQMSYIGSPAKSGLFCSPLPSRDFQFQYPYPNHNSKHIATVKQFLR